jgi:hypothetical protein
MLNNPADPRRVRFEDFPAALLLSPACSSSGRGAVTTPMPRQIYRSMLCARDIPCSARKARPIFPCESIAATIIAHRAALRKAEQFSPEQNWQKT